MIFIRGRVRENVKWKEIFKILKLISNNINWMLPDNKIAHANWIWAWSLNTNNVIIIAEFRITETIEGVKKLLFAFKIELSRELKETKIKNGNVILSKKILFSNNK